MEFRCKLIAITLLGIPPVLCAISHHSKLEIEETPSEFGPSVVEIDRAPSGSKLSVQQLNEAASDAETDNEAASEFERVPLFNTARPPNRDFGSLMGSLDNFWDDMHDFDAMIETEKSINRPVESKIDPMLITHIWSQFRKLKPIKAITAKIVQSERKRHLEARIMFLETLRKGYLALREGHPSSVIESIEQAKVLSQNIKEFKAKDPLVKFNDHENYLRAERLFIKASEACALSRTVSGFSRDLSNVALWRQHMETEWKEAGLRSNNVAKCRQRLLNLLWRSTQPNMKEKAIEAATLALLREAEEHERLSNKGPDLNELQVHLHSIERLRVEAQKIRKQILDPKLAQIDLNEVPEYQQVKSRLEKAKQAWTMQAEASHSGGPETKSQASYSGAQEGQAQASHSQAQEDEIQASHHGAPEGRRIQDTYSKGKQPVL